jgi:hypothetical protein
VNLAPVIIGSGRGFSLRWVGGHPATPSRVNARLSEPNRRPRVWANQGGWEHPGRSFPKYGDPRGWSADGCDRGAFIGAWLFLMGPTLFYDWLSVVRRHLRGVGPFRKRSGEVTGLWLCDVRSPEADCADRWHL